MYNTIALKMKQKPSLQLNKVSLSPGEIPMVNKSSNHRIWSPRTTHIKQYAFRNDRNKQATPKFQDSKKVMCPSVPPAFSQRNLIVSQ